MKKKPDVENLVELSLKGAVSLLVLHFYSIRLRPENLRIRSYYCKVRQGFCTFLSVFFFKSKRLETDTFFRFFRDRNAVLHNIIKNKDGIKKLKVNLNKMFFFRNSEFL
jgi:hypothetical protein